MTCPTCETEHTVRHYGQDLERGEDFSFSALDKAEVCAHPDCKKELAECCVEESKAGRCEVCKKIFCSDHFLSVFNECFACYESESEGAAY